MHANESAARHGPVDRDMARLERIILTDTADFSALFMAVGSVAERIAAGPDRASHPTVAALARRICRPSHAIHKQALFLYRHVAETLAGILTSAALETVREHALRVLETTCVEGVGRRQQAASEALGGLPVTISGPALTRPFAGNWPRATYDDILARCRMAPSARPRSAGRSVVVPVADGTRLLVIKIARRDPSGHSLLGEFLWMHHLAGVRRGFPVRFHVPRPVTVNGRPLFSISRLPFARGKCDPLPPPPWTAMAYTARPDYFVYPNDHRPGGRLSLERFTEIIHRNAWLLGRLTAMGIVHTAPIPLFHNRIQQDRRADQGRYEWHRGGRLDRWLASCRFPNFGDSGLRDFEHLASFSGSGVRLYRLIGSHILSLLLVTGSYFRHARPDTAGFDRHGKPADLRELFDHTTLTPLIAGIFNGYYGGFTGGSRPDRWRLPFAALADRMIAEMGVDRHMEEILRVTDQRHMTDARFAAFLKAGGFSESEIARVSRGKHDIRILTGPHLGAFNGRISLPELTAFVASAAAVCISGKYRATCGTDMGPAGFGDF